MNKRIYTQLYMVYLIVGISFLQCTHTWAQNTTPANELLDVSMFWKKTGENLHWVEDEKGDLFKKLGHHGPAIENAYLAYRVYFNESGSVDILSKFKPRLELKTSLWYPKKNNCPSDFGTDNYHVGKSVGLGGINLYDPSFGLQQLGPVNNRTAEVILTDTTAQLIMTSYGIPYSGTLVDIEFRLTSRKGDRHATVQVKELNGIPVQFTTGLSINNKVEIIKGENYLITWGDYNSHAKYAVFNIGAGILYNPNDFVSTISEDGQELLVSAPVNHLNYIISACNDKEESAINSLSSFESYMKQLASPTSQQP